MTPARKSHLFALVLALALLFAAACDSKSSGRGDARASGILDAATGPDVTDADIGSHVFLDASPEGPLSADAAPGDASDDSDGGPPPPPCTTRVSYGSTWIHGPGHPDNYDDAPGVITWNGTCQNDAAGNSFAMLSNGWVPYFTGRSACLIALDYSESCSSVPATCRTRITYGRTWERPSDHPAQFDDVPDALLWDGVCHSIGAQSFAELSNGWTPYFSGGAGCEISFRYEQCGGLYTNPVVATNCPDPGVLHEDDQYIMVCTSGSAPNVFPIRTSSDLIHWAPLGFVFPEANRPRWATGDFWAPEVHHVGDVFIVYYSARARSDGQLSIGAASGPSPVGPFTDLGRPLLHDPSIGLIDASEYESPDGTRYLLWKVDGNAVGQPTPVNIQRLGADGMSLRGSATTLITNDQRWEGRVVEGPWMIDHDGMYYLFYSGNGYASAAYGMGVARASSPLGPFTKLSTPLIASKGAWEGPGHGAVVTSPSGQTAFVYHAWSQGHINEAPGRQVLLDRVLWNGGWPAMPQAPSSRSLPPP